MICVTNSQQYWGQLCSQIYTYTCALPTACVVLYPYLVHVYIIYHSASFSVTHF